MDYNNITLKGLRDELNYNKDGLKQNEVEKRIKQINIKGLEESYKNSSNNIYLILKNEELWELSFIDKNINKYKKNIMTLENLITNYKEPNYIKNNTFIQLNLCTDMENLSSAI